MVKVLTNKKVATEFSKEAEKLRKKEITDLEFDEFTKLDFKICNIEPEHLFAVWATVVEIKNTILPVSNKE